MLDFWRRLARPLPWSDPDGAPPARRVGRVAGASHQRHSPSSRTSLAPGERPARPAVGPRPGRAPRRGGSGAGQRRTRHRHEPPPRGDGAGVVSQEPFRRPHSSWDLTEFTSRFPCPPTIDLSEYLPSFVLDHIYTISVVDQEYLPVKYQSTS